MKEQKLFINDMNYMNQHYTIKIFGFVPNSSFQKKIEPFCIFNNESFGLSYVPITETLQFRLTRNFFVKLDLETINARENINILNALSCDAQNQWYAAKDGEEVSVHYANLQEIKGLRDLVENDKVKLSSHDKTETLELIAQYEQTYPDLIKLMGEEDDII